MPAVSSLDILRAAKLLADRHGEDAMLHAAMRVDELTDAGDEAGAQVWRSILKTIGELQRTTMSPGEGRH